MTSPRLALLALLAPVAIAAQAPPAYRGFTPGISYRAFIERARALADSDVVRCQSSSHTAQLMECGVVIRDPSDVAVLPERALCRRQRGRRGPVRFGGVQRRARRCAREPHQKG